MISASFLPKFKVRLIFMKRTLSLFSCFLGFNSPFLRLITEFFSLQLFLVSFFFHLFIFMALPYKILFGSVLGLRWLYLLLSSATSIGRYLRIPFSILFFFRDSLRCLYRPIGLTPFFEFYLFSADSLSLPYLTFGFPKPFTSLDPLNI